VTGNCSAFSISAQKLLDCWHAHGIIGFLEHEGRDQTIDIQPL
jgi:hypothetical protein